jgi:hypothetical protein
VGVIQARVGLALFRARKSTNRPFAFCISSIQTMTLHASDRDRLERPLMTGHQTTLPFGDLTIGDERSIRQRCEHMGATIDTDGLARLHQGVDVAFALEYRVPAAILFDDERATKLRHRATLAKLDPADLRNSDLCLSFIEPNCTIAVGEFQLPPP